MIVRNYIVLYKGKRRGPVSKDELVRALRAGKIPDSAEIRDLYTGDILLPSDLLDEPIAPVASGPRRKIDYGRDQSVVHLAREVQELRAQLDAEGEARNLVAIDVIAWVLLLLICPPLALIAIPFFGRKAPGFVKVAALLALLVLIVVIAGIVIHSHTSESW
jgi:hypothetical protein